MRIYILFTLFSLNQIYLLITFIREVSKRIAGAVKVKCWNNISICFKYILSQTYDTMRWLFSNLQNSQTKIIIISQVKFDRLTFTDLTC